MTQILSIYQYKRFPFYRYQRIYKNMLMKYESKFCTQFKCIPQNGIRIEPLSTHWIRIQEVLDRMELFLHLNIWLSFTACKSNSLIVIWSHIWIRADMLSCYNMLSKPFRSHTKVLELLVSTCHLINFVWEKQTSISNINFKYTITEAY